MRIIINTLSVYPEKTGGGETFLSQLVKNLSQIDEINDYLLLVNKKNSPLFEVRKKNFNLIYFSNLTIFSPLRVFWEQFIILFAIKKFKADIFYSPTDVVPLINVKKSVMTVQNILHLKFPKQIRLIKRVYLKFFVTLSARRAAKIIAVSKKAKEAFLNFTKVPEQKIEVIYEGVSENFVDLARSKDRHEIEKILLKYGLDKEYILSVSALYSHKNLDILIEAFIKVKNEYKLPHRLVLVGRDLGHQRKKLNNLAENLNITKEIIFIDYIPYEELIYFYQKASLFVFPSSCEAFGLPLLEAMACVCPVIASKAEAIPEIAGEAAVYVDARDIGKLAFEMYDILIDEQKREDLIEKGLARVKEFSWKKTALQIHRTFKEINKQN